MKFPFLFKHAENASTPNNATSAWPWPTCASSPKTLSFRANTSNNSTTTMFNTIKSAHVQETDRDGNNLLLADQLIGSPSSSFCSLLHDENNCKVDLRSSDRLTTFQPGESSSILEEVKPAQNDGTSVDLSCNKEISHVTVMAMDSCDPFLDFRVSMEEMVRAHGLKRWECLEDLLTSYLRVNEKSNHGYIVGAFVDLLVNIYLSNCDDNDDTNDDDDVEQCDNSCSCSGAAVINQDLHEVSFTSPLSFCSSSCSFSSPSTEVSEGLLVVNNRVNVAEKSISSNSCSSSSLSCNTASS